MTINFKFKHLNRSVIAWLVLSPFLLSCGGIRGPNQPAAVESNQTTNFQGRAQTNPFVTGQTNVTSNPFVQPNIARPNPPQNNQFVDQNVLPNPFVQPNIPEPNLPQNNQFVDQNVLPNPYVRPNIPIANPPTNFQTTPTLVSQMPSQNNTVTPNPGQRLSQRNTNVLPAITGNNSGNEEE